MKITNKSNYLAKVVEIKEFHPHPNADRLKTAKVDYQSIITGIDNKEGVYVYFPAECCLSAKFLSETDSYRDVELNKGESVGFFEKSGRVKALKLRGEVSNGYIVPKEVVEQVYGIKINSVGVEFDTINDELVCWKYEPPKKAFLEKGKRQSKALNRLVDGQVYLHEDTDNLRRYYKNLSLDDEVSITYKFHGSNITLQHVLVKRKLSWFERLIKNFVPVKEKEYDLVITSRRVVKNKYFDDPKNQGHYYDYDVWEDVSEKYDVKNKLPKGYCLYGEVIGFTKDGGYIQKGYDYGCQGTELIVFRVTNTNEDGVVVNLSTSDAKKFCDEYGFRFVPIFFNGQVSELVDNVEDLVPYLEEKYNNKNCYLCENKVPEEGVVIRKERIDKFEAYKLKSELFLIRETKQLDNE